MYLLYGIEESVSGEDQDGNFIFATEKNPLALFDTAEDAEKYIQDSERKNRPKYPRYCDRVVFKKTSLLRNYTEAEIENIGDLPKNPKMEK